MDHPLCMTFALMLYGLLAADSGYTQGFPEKVEALRKENNLPSLSVLVFKEGKIVAEVATGTRKIGDPTPVTLDDQYHIGSNTKAMTATLAALLVEQGKIKWTTTVEEVFPVEAQEMNPTFRKVTLEELLTNLGGCPNTLDHGDIWGRAWKRNESESPRMQRKLLMLDVMKHAPDAEPGKKFIYSNAGFSIAGAMLEEVMDREYEDMIQDLLFKPMGMTTAGFGVPDITGTLQQPWGHAMKNGVLTANPPKGGWTASDNPVGIAPAGLVHMSLRDYARFAQLHLGKNKVATPLISNASLEKLHTPPIGDYAMGWFVVPRDWAGGKALNHAGSNLQWYFVAWLAPEKDFFVLVATNCTTPTSSQACDQMASLAIQEFLP